MKRCKAYGLPVLSFWLLLASLLSVGCAPSGPRYVILLIGDGMGPVQVEAARRFAADQDPGFVALAMDRLPYSGPTTTHSANSKVTDSAAGGTALACGAKTNNGMLGQRPDAAPLVSMAEAARDDGRRVGVITSVPTNHATPASFYAHVASRHSYDEIAEQFLISGFDVLGGGGTSFKGDRAAYEQRLAQAGYATAVGRAEMAALVPGDRAVIVYDGKRTSFPPVIDAEPGSFTLAEMTAKTLELLEGPEGFFLMVEGGQIDWQGHSNDAAANIRETLDFDAAVAAALDFYERHPDETLVVVSADHETGGMSLDAEAPLPVGSLADQTCSYGALVGRLAALSPEQQADWDAVLAVIDQAMALSPLSEAERVELQKAWMDSQMSKEDMKKLGWSKQPTAITAVKLKAARCGIGWSTFGHSATPITTRAIGVGAKLFEGPMDNTDVGKRLMAFFGYTVPDPAEDVKVETPVANTAAMSY